AVADARTAKKGLWATCDTTSTTAAAQTTTTAARATTTTARATTTAPAATTTTAPATTSSSVVVPTAVLDQPCSPPGATGMFTDAPVSWAARTEQPGGKTSPEELIAAAHAACFCMALSNELSSRDHAPERLDVEATCTFVPGTGITTIDLTVTAAVPGADDA